MSFGLCASWFYFRLQVHKIKKKKPALLAASVELFSKHNTRIFTSLSQVGFEDAIHRQSGRK